MHLAHVPSISIVVCYSAGRLPGDLVDLSAGRHRRVGARTKSDDIKDFDGLVYSRRRKTSTVLTDTNALDFSDVCPELLHRFDADANLLQELYHSINRACEEEVGERCHGDK